MRFWHLVSPRNCQKGGRRSAHRNAPRKLHLEHLEERTVPATILVSQGSGPFIGPNQVVELDMTGTQLRTFDLSAVGMGLRDLVVDPDGNFQIYNGTFDPQLTTLDPLTSNTQDHTFAEWSTVSNISYGGIDAFQQYIYVTDMDTANDPAQGIVRFDRTDYSAQRFASTTEPIDLTMGLDGVLYALQGDERTVHKYDPITMNTIGTVLLAQGNRGIAVDTDGKIYGASWDGNIYGFDANGALLTTLASGGNNLIDIHIRPGGDLVASSHARVFLTDTTLASVNNTLSVSGAGGFVTFNEFTPVGGSNFQLQILHASDLGGNQATTSNAPGFGAVVEALENDAASQGIGSILLSGGDNYLRGPFFDAAANPSVRDELQAAYQTLFNEPGLTNIREGAGRVDMSILNILGVDASAVGNREFDLGSATFQGLIEEDIPGLSLNNVQWLGAQFPYLSANLDFSADASLANLFTSEILPHTAFQADLTNLPATQALPKLAPATTIQVAGQQVGVVGATTQLLESISSPSGTVGTAGTVEDMPTLANILNPIIMDVRNGADNILGNTDDVNKIVLVSHLQDINLEQALVPLLNGVDVVIAGGSDTLLADPSDVLRPGDAPQGSYPILTTNADGEPALVVSTVGRYNYVGRLVLEFDVAGVLVVSSLDPNTSGAYATDEAGVLAVTGAPDLGTAIANSPKATEIQKLLDAVNVVPPPPLPLSTFDSITTFDPLLGAWFLRSETSAGIFDAGGFTYGLPGWKPVLGDWNGDGVDTIGVVDNTGVSASGQAIWYLSNKNDAGSPDITPFPFGLAGWVPVVGDWDGDGVTGIGMVDPTTGIWYLRNTPDAGPVSVAPFAYGLGLWDPVVGDWDGDGMETIGTFDPLSGTWYLRNSNAPGAPDTSFVYGLPTWQPVAGDWDGDGVSTPAVVDINGVWYISNTPGGGVPSIAPFSYGLGHWVPMAGTFIPTTTSLRVSTPGAGTNVPALANADLQATVDAALRRLSVAGVESDVVQGLIASQFTVANLPGSLLGLVDVASRVAYLDSDAAGHGWFVDPTPGEDSEFQSTGSPGLLEAVPGLGAEGKPDLLTGVLHELARIAGNEPTNAGQQGSILRELLEPGQRRILDLDQVFMM